MEARIVPNNVRGQLLALLALRARSLTAPVPEYAVSEIVEAAKAGRLDPQQAEALAAYLGVGPLAAAPVTTPGSEGDPWNRHLWSLGMVVAWIAYRSDDRVRDAWVEYRAACLEWRDIRRVDLKGNRIGPPRWDLLPARAQTVADMWDCEDADIDAGLLRETVTRSLEELRLRLFDEDVKAFGIAMGDATERRTAIAPDQWIDLQVDFDARGQHRIANRRTPTSPSYMDVLFDSRRLREFWPAPAVEEARKQKIERRVANLKGNGRAKVKYREDEVVAFAKQYLNDESQDRRIKEGFWPAMKKRFPGISSTLRDPLAKNFGPKTRLRD